MTATLVVSPQDLSTVLRALTLAKEPDVGIDSILTSGGLLQPAQVAQIAPWAMLLAPQIPRWVWLAFEDASLHRQGLRVEIVG